MNISIQTLLTKIEEELKLAQSSAKPESLREQVYSIKILCELILDESPAARTKAAVEQAYSTSEPQPAMNRAAFQQPMRQQQVQQQMQQQAFQQPVSVQPGKKLEMDNEANGDSLFDF